MSSVAVAETCPSRGDGHDIVVRRRRTPTFPIDYYREQPIGQPFAGIRSAYLLDGQDIESARCLNDGWHHVRGGRQTLVLESDDRLYLEPAVDCILEYAAGRARLAVLDAGCDHLTVGVQSVARPPLATGPEITSLFECFSTICSAPGEASPYRSHPFFRPGVPDVRVSAGDRGPGPASGHAAISLHLPPDLRYLYAAVPLAYYLGASLFAGREPTLEAGHQSIDLPGSCAGFERWSGKMLGRTFQMDCAVRAATTAKKRLPGIDVLGLTGHTPEELMLVNMPDRFLLYVDTLRSHGRAFHAWPAASYVPPAPSSAELLPYLLRSLSAVYTPKSVRVSEREVVSRSVKGYRSQLPGPDRGEAGGAGEVLLPSISPAQAQHWYGGGCPVDASLASIDALRNARKYARDRRAPEVCIVCNEGSMAREARQITDRLEGIARVDLRTGVGREDLLHTFSEGYDLVHFTGHCERPGLKCPDGHADLSRVGACDVPVFFLNSCQSYRQGARLIEKGAVCGVATMFRLLDEAALGVCENFYRMLACGYPVITAYLAARECSATGKEYLLIGDGSYAVFNGGEGFRPFYKLSRNGLGFTLQCNGPGGKGLIRPLDNGLAVPDTGFEVDGLGAGDLARDEEGFGGMCLYGGCLYDSVPVAVEAALIDLRRAAGRMRTKRIGPKTTR